MGYDIKIKTSGITTYDNIYSVVTASDLSDKYVKYYNYDMQTTSSNQTIFDEIYLKGYVNSTVTTSIASSIFSNGNSVTSTTSYSYNPNFQSISNQLGLANKKT